MFIFWIKDSWSLFRYYKIRFILSLIGIIVGIGAMCALVSVKNCVSENSQKLLEKYGESRFVVTLIPSHKYFSYQTVNEFSDRLKPEFDIVPYQLLNVIAFLQKKKIESMIIATDPSMFTQMQWSVSEGRMLAASDNLDKVALIGAKVARDIKKRTNMQVVGSLISIEGNYYHIVGVLAEKDFNPLLDFEVNRTIFVNLPLMGRLKGRSTIDSFIVQGRTRDLLSEEQMFTKILNDICPQCQLFIKDARMFQKALQQQVSITLKILAILAAITLFLGMVSILNLLIILVQERKKEVGIRLAFGATSKKIGYQFLRETLILCTIGGVCGIFLGKILSYVMVISLNMTYHDDWLSWIVGFPLSVAIAAVVGFIPAILAAKWDPVKLLNS